MGSRFLLWDMGHYKCIAQEQERILLRSLGYILYFVCVTLFICMSSICLLCCLTRVCESVIRERNEVISHICTWHAELSRNYSMCPWVEEIGLENYQIFTGVPVNFKQVFNGVPISKRFLRSREESPSSNGNPVRFGDPNTTKCLITSVSGVCMYVCIDVWRSSYLAEMFLIDLMYRVHVSMY